MITSKAIKNRSRVTTLIVLILLLLILILASWTVEKEIESPMDGGVEVSLGHPESGGPDVEPSQQEEVVEEVQQEQAPPDVVTQDQEDAPEVQTSETTTTTTTTTPTEPVEETPTEPTEKPREADPNSLFKKNTDSKGQGGDESGDKGEEDGDEDGDPNGKGGDDGPGDIGPGISGGIGGFKVVSNPDIKNQRQDRGTVKVRVCVDATGNVIPMMTQWKGGTASSAYLKQLSIENANKFRFKRIGTATETNCGIITFTYKSK